MAVKKKAPKAKAKKATKPAKKSAAKRSSAKKPAPKAKKKAAPKPKAKAKKPAPKAKKKAAPKPKPAAPKKPAPQAKAPVEREAALVAHRVEEDEPRETAGAPAGIQFKMDRSEGEGIGDELGEDFVRTATGGDEAAEEHDHVTPDEVGGPFVPSGAKTEFASGPDASNPLDAEVAATPSVLSEDEGDEDEEVDGDEEDEEESE